MGKTKFNPWFIVLGAMGASVLTITFLCNTAGLFLSPVMEEFGFSRTQASLYMTIFAWVAAAIQPIVGKIYAKYDLRVISTVVVALFGLSYIWSSTFTHLWQWNLFGVLYGIGAGFFMYMAQPIMFARWFKKRIGLAMQLPGLIIGIISIWANPAIQSLINNEGWQKARLITGIVITVISVILCILFIRNSPEDCGMNAYGDDGEENGQVGEKGHAVEFGVMAKQALRMPGFYMLLIFAFIANLCPSLIQQLPSYAGSKPIGAMAGAYALTVFSVTGIPRGPLVGWFFDKVGSIIGNVVCVVIGALGVVMILLTGGANAVVFYVGVALFGFAFVPLTMGSALLTKEIFGDKDYSNVFSYVTFITLISSGLTPLIYAQIYDRSGSYTGCLVLAVVVSVIQLVLVPFIAGTKRKVKQISTEK